MKILITGSFRISAEQLDMLRQVVTTVDVHADERNIVPNPEIYDVVVCNGLFLYNNIENFTNLKFVQLTSAGLDRVPLDYLREHSIKINNARGVYSIPMAEYAVFGTLQLMKQGRYFLKNQEAHAWIKHRELVELCGKTVCIIGCGSVGTECAKRFRAFGCHVIGVDLYPREDSNFERILNLDELYLSLRMSQVIVLTLPLTEQTRHLIDRQAFEQMPKGAILVNIARGAIVDTDALLDALNSNLGGAVLDVFEQEPLNADSPLWDMEHVILTPHNSFVGENNNDRLWNVIWQSIHKFIGEYNQ